MDWNEQLRLHQEIQQLSHLIASSNANGSSSSNQVYSTARIVNNYSIRPHPVVVPTYNYSNGKVANVVKYSNPFDPFCNDAYVNQVFPDSSNGSSVGKLSRKVGTLSSSSTKHKSHSSPYKLKNSRSSASLNGSSKQKATVSSISPSTGATVRPTSVYINPSYLAKVSSSGNSGPSSQVRVRPHVNPAHAAFQLLTSASGGETSCQQSNHGAEVHTYPIPAVDNDVAQASTSTKECDNAFKPQINRPLQKQVSIRKPINNIPAKNTYKLDRRLKRSPVRKVTKTNLVNKPHSLQKTKLVKRYSSNSMRVISTSKISPLSWHYYKMRKPVVGTHFHKKLSFVKSRVLNSAGVKTSTMHSVKKGKKSVVSIDGNNYIRKNGGKSLKRMSSKLNVVSINGNRFIQKNGGKSLKRLSESLSTTKSKLLPILSQQQTVGVRLANRAILKSKITLSQRIWKKKQFCVFYNRFGECKRKNSGTCPYTHDRKQLMICPKFIVGKCASKDCKLSHDLNLGRMPPCQFFNKSECSRENCPYPHIKSSPLVKKSSETGKRNKRSEEATSTQVKSPVRKRKVSIKKENSSPTSAEKKKRKRKDPKARYYEQEPDSQPIVSIIPRRLPKEPKKEPSTEKEELPTSIIKQEDEKVPGSSNGTTNPSCNPQSGTTRPVDDRRTRLMDKISRLHERAKKKESTAPQFLPFT